LSVAVFQIYFCHGDWQGIYGRRVACPIWEYGSAGVVLEDLQMAIALHQPQFYFIYVTCNFSEVKGCPFCSRGLPH